MGLLSIDDLFATATVDEWKNTILKIGTTLKLAVTAWQPGGIARTMIAILATVESRKDTVMQIFIKGALLDYASEVTPDPSVIPGAVPGWLDFISVSYFDNPRLDPTFASGPLAIANIQGVGYGPYDPGAYHVADPSTGKTYNNTSTLNIPASTLAAAVSSATNTTPIVVQTAAAHGLASGDVIYVPPRTGAPSPIQGFWSIVVTDATHFSLDGSVASGVLGAGDSVYTAFESPFAADLSGSSSSAAPGRVTQPVLGLIGVSVSNLLSFVGNDAESNASLVARDKAKLASLSPDGPAGAYEYFAKTAFDLLASGQLLPSDPENTYPIVTLTGGRITRALVQVNKLTGTVTTTVANDAGPVTGITNLFIIDATNATPIEVQTAASHGLNTNDFVSIDGVLGNTNTNGTWQITVTGVDTFELNDSSGNGAWTAGGQVDGGDLGEVDRIVSANAVPQSVTSVIQSAGTVNIAIVATVYVPMSLVPGFAGKVSAALANFFKTIPIGGFSDPSGDYTNVLPYQEVADAIQQTDVTNVKNLTLTVNGGTANVAIPTTSVAVISPAPVITVKGV